MMHNLFWAFLVIPHISFWAIAHNGSFETCEISHDIITPLAIGHELIQQLLMVRGNDSCMLLLTFVTGGLSLM